MKKVLVIGFMALLLVGCGKHPAQQGIEEAFAAEKAKCIKPRPLRTGLYAVLTVHECAPNGQTL